MVFEYKQISGKYWLDLESRRDFYDRIILIGFMSISYGVNKITHLGLHKAI